MKEVEFEMSYQMPRLPQNRPSYRPTRTNTNVLAIASFISAFFLSLLAVILGHVALSQIKRTGERGSGLAIAGLILGYLGSFVWILFWVGVASASEAPSPAPQPAMSQQPTRAATVTLDNMQGKTLKEAEEAAISKGLKYTVVSPSTLTSNNPGSWEVTTQTPAAGIPLAKGSTVIFSVKDSTASNKIAVPDVKGMKATKAKTLLQEAGLKVAWNKKIGNAGNWVVSKTYPAGKELVASGTTVKIYVKRPAGYVSSNPKDNIPQVFKNYFSERSNAGVRIAESVTDVTFKNGVVTVTFDPDAIGIDRDTFEYINPFENLADFAASPIAFDDTTGNRVRPLVKSIKTQYPDGTSLGTLDHAGILAMNGLDK